MEWRIDEKGRRCFGHRWGRNGELCAAVGPSTIGLLAYWQLYMLV